MWCKPLALRTLRCRLVEARAELRDEDVRGRDDPLTLGAWTILDGSSYPEAGRKEAVARALPVPGERTHSALPTCSEPRDINDLWN